MPHATFHYFHSFLKNFFGSEAVTISIYSLFAQQVVMNLKQKFSKYIHIINSLIYPMFTSQNCQTLGISLVLVRNPLSKKYLAVHQKNGSWWLPGGRVDAPETFSKGAIRETKQEGGIDVSLKGILRFQSSPSTQFLRKKIIFYAQPKDPNQNPKDFKDSESMGAEYMSLQKILSIKNQWRGPQLYEWANYLENGGKVHPLELLEETYV